MRLVALSLIMLTCFCSCRQTEQTEVEPGWTTVTSTVEGYVYHKYHKTPMAGVKMNAVAHRRESKNWASVLIYDILDSATTDGNGHFEMSFKHKHNEGAYNENEYHVICVDKEFERAASFAAGRITSDTRLIAYDPMVLKAVITAKNVTRRLEFLPDNKKNVYSVTKDVTDMILYPTVEPETNYNAMFKYTDSLGKRHDFIIPYKTPKYTDTISERFNVDASTF